jgi:hypothetical protein
MHITCLTVAAAADVVSLVLRAGIPLGNGVRVSDPYPAQLPIRFTIAVPLPTELVNQLRMIPDTTIVDEEAA